MLNKQDVLIVGTGVAGSLLALAILKSSPLLKIALVDENEPSKNKKHPSFDARSIALSAGSCQLLNDIDCWHKIKTAAQPIDDIHISDRGYFSSFWLPTSPTPFGYVVELEQMGETLSQALNQYKNNITRIFQHRLEKIDQHSDRVCCHFQSDQNESLHISAKLCVGADGLHSKTRQLLNIKYRQSDYESCAIIANIETSTSHKNRAFERFTDAGPIALLPITKDRYSLVWTLKEADAQTIKQCDETEFLAKLQSAFGFRAGVFTKTGKRDIYPLSLLTTDRPIAHRGLCIGNAAHHLPPVMGQGFNLGMRDLATLAKVISEFPNNIGDFSMLQRYWQQREKDHQTTINMTDSIVRVFSNPSPCFKIARNVGLQLMAHSSTLSQPLVTQAKGQQKGNLNAIF